jgi:hypothetical protein
VANKCDRLSKVLISFESRDLSPTKVFDMCSDLYIWMRSELDTPDLNNKIKTCLTDSIAKFKKYLYDGGQPGMDFFENARILDPYIFKYLDPDINNYHKLPDSIKNDFR